MESSVPDPLTAGLSAVPVPSAPDRPSLRYADIGINLSDPIFRGLHDNHRRHEDDLQHVVHRALETGVRKMMITGSDLEQSKAAIALAREYPGLCYATVGVHPCSAKQFETHPGGESDLLRQLKDLVVKGRSDGNVTAFGEIGLDYDRLHYCDKETQLRTFEQQLELAIELQMPLFLHSRAAAQDFGALLSARLDKLPKRGLVHSFTGTMDEMQHLVSLGFDIGINGCSMKTEENVAVVKKVPLERLQIETDGPWCEMRPSHASAKYLIDAPKLPKAVKKEKWSSECMVKGRNEPCAISQVAHAVAAIKEVNVEEVCEAAWRNSLHMFGLGEESPSTNGNPH
ncbi:hypothetical protein B0A48_11317 [Cryoendolithus antarcticus]|uniref:Uncharacterized protein n=1 Tax=Cryoendolithus antarcticus TaxID=1507870 RepID=A0A1V8SV51_9PEZI|nr:hypothetical protein B0A48_11317 [Cryoendolithus antarcticus]